MKQVLCSFPVLLALARVAGLAILDIGVLVAGGTVVAAAGFVLVAAWQQVTIWRLRVSVLEAK